MKQCAKAINLSGAEQNQHMLTPERRPSVFVEKSPNKRIRPDIAEDQLLSFDLTDPLMGKITFDDVVNELPLPKMSFGDPLMDRITFDDVGNELPLPKVSFGAPQAPEQSLLKRRRKQV